MNVRCLKWRIVYWILLVQSSLLMNAQSAVAIAFEFPKQYYQSTGEKDIFIRNTKAHTIFSVRYRYLFQRTLSANAGLEYRHLNVGIGIKNRLLMSSIIGGGLHIPLMLGYHKQLNSGRFSINPTFGPCFDLALPKGNTLTMGSSETTGRDTMVLLASAVIDRSFGFSIAAGLSLEFRAHSRLYFSIYTAFSKGLLPLITANVHYKDNQRNESSVQKYYGTYLSWFGVRVFYAIRPVATFPENSGS